MQVCVISNDAEVRSWYNSPLYQLECSKKNQVMPSSGAPSDTNDDRSFMHRLLEHFS